MHASSILYVSGMKYKHLEVAYFDNFVSTIGEQTLVPLKWSWLLCVCVCVCPAVCPACVCVCVCVYPAGLSLSQNTWSDEPVQTWILSFQNRAGRLTTSSSVRPRESEQSRPSDS